ncbi:MAG TPA: VOC family protein [Micrococcaceae bacterium]|nr:VOC family protein [Micrococcaceae bacterium]
MNDLAAAKNFYGGILGLRVSEANGFLDLHLAGGARILVYPSPGHSPASYTILNFSVPDIEEAVAALAEKGIRLERYPQMESGMDEKGIFRGGGPLIAWFKDPAGNILSVLEDTAANA